MEKPEFCLHCYTFSKSFQWQMFQDIMREVHYLHLCLRHHLTRSKRKTGEGILQLQSQICCTRGKLGIRKSKIHFSWSIGMPWTDSGHLQRSLGECIWRIQNPIQFNNFSKGCLENFRRIFGFFHPFWLSYKPHWECTVFPLGAIDRHLKPLTITGLRKFTATVHLSISKPRFPGTQQILTQSPGQDSCRLVN